MDNMDNKVILILVDGMRPDSIGAIPFVQKFIKDSSYTLSANTVSPTVTLPCHMSLFHSVTPKRHGITTNTFVPQVSPINGLCEQLGPEGKICAFFYNWGNLRDLAKPQSLAYSFFISGRINTYEKTNVILTHKAIEYINDSSPDFVFLYLGYTDWAGHAYGWMSDEYMQSVRSSWDCIEELTDSISKKYTVFVTSDHGGHDRTHGTDEKEDLTIPIIVKGPNFTKNRELGNLNIIDIAPTITDLLNLEPAEGWEGLSFLKTTT